MNLDVWACDHMHLEVMQLVFFFKQKTAYEVRISDWSSDVCSSDLVVIDGIREVEAADIAYAETLGFKVRLVGIAQADANGLFQRVHACLAPVAHPLAHVDGSLNAVVAEGNFVGRLFFQGSGAGEGPTA